MTHDDFNSNTSAWSIGHSAAVSSGRLNIVDPSKPAILASISDSGFASIECTVCGHIVTAGPDESTIFVPGDPRLCEHMR